APRQPARQGHDVGAQSGHPHRDAAAHRRSEHAHCRSRGHRALAHRAATRRRDFVHVQRRQLRGAASPPRARVHLDAPRARSQVRRERSSARARRVPAEAAQLALGPAAAMKRETNKRSAWIVAALLLLTACKRPYRVGEYVLVEWEEGSPHLYPAYITERIS